MKDQIKKAFTAGYMATSTTEVKPIDYQNKIIDNAFRKWYHDHYGSAKLDDVPNTHILKTVNPHFENVYNGLKPYEIRENDRAFKVGDLLILREYKPIKTAPVHSGRREDGFLLPQKYSGRYIVAMVTLITEFPQGLQENYVALSIQVLHKQGYQDV